MALQNILQKKKEEIEKKIADAVELLGEKSRLRDACEYALCNGGKRFRPALVMMINKALKSNVDVTFVALGVEFFHTASLIADDLPCMDDDDMRRGKPSLHKKYNEATALLASYALIGAGYRAIYENTESLKTSDAPHSNNAAEICCLALENATYNTGIQGATGGQFLDIYPPDYATSTLQDVIHKKTGTLFEISFVFGWLFSGGDIQKLDLVKKAAWHFGMAFQMQDDLEDVNQDNDNEKTVNIASQIGIEKTVKMLCEEIKSLEKIIMALHIDSDEFSSLTAFLANKAKTFAEEHGVEII